MRFTGTWCSQDLFFLMNALRRGDMSCAEVAGFVGRDVVEVRDKAEQIGIKVPPLNSRAAKAKSRSDASRQGALEPPWRGARSRGERRGRYH
jgi:hypothetical protein